MAYRKEKLEELIKRMISDLLIKGEIKDYITSFNGNLSELIATFQDPETLLFSHKGALKKSFNEVFIKDLSKNIVAIIGGFQKGMFSRNISDLSQELLSISKHHLEAWIVTSKVINYYEILHDIL